jgi:hypothetical protein
MSDIPEMVKHDNARVPEGAGIIERVGWDDDGRFTATIVFPNGPPDLKAIVVWKSLPVWLSTEAPTAKATP